MKLEKGEQIHICNIVMKSHSNLPNSGFARFDSETKIVEFPGAWYVFAPATALDCEICDSCQRIYRFNNPGARAQCECRGEEVGGQNQ